jgi:hypothetical protein
MKWEEHGELEPDGCGEEGSALVFQISKIFHPFERSFVLFLSWRKIGARFDLSEKAKTFPVSSRAIENLSLEFLYLIVPAPFIGTVSNPPQNTSNTRLFNCQSYITSSLGGKFRIHTQLAINFAAGID